MSNNDLTLDDLMNVILSIFEPLVKQQNEIVDTLNRLDDSINELIKQNKLGALQANDIIRHKTPFDFQKKKKKE